MSESKFEPPVFWSDKLYTKICAGVSSAKCGVGNWRRKRAKEALESRLADIINAANGHAAKGTPHGSEVFVALERKADGHIRHFAETWGVDELEVRAQAPALNDLHKLTLPARKVSAGTKLFAAFLTGGLGLVLIGACSGVIQAAHDWVFHLLTHIH